MALPAALEQNPQLRDWVEFHGDRISVRTGKVELGQGISTAIAMIAAEELDFPIVRIDVLTGSTASGPNEFMTAGSMSIEGSGMAVRQACAEVRQFLLETAAAQFGVPPDELTIEDGIIRNPATNDSASFSELMAGDQLEITATGLPVPKPASEHRVVGHTTTRIDLEAKLTGAPAFVQDYRAPGMHHGRIVRSKGIAWHMDTIDTSEVETMPGVLKVVVDGDFIGVVAESEYGAVKAKEKLEQLACWKAPAGDPLPGDVHEFLMNNAGVSLQVVEGTPNEDPIPERTSGADTIRAVYKKPYHMHGSAGPSAALATFVDGRLVVESHSQGPYVIRGALAVALGMNPEDIIVNHAENAGCYGHNGADDAAMDAAMLARAVPGIPVLLKWQREDEHAWEPYSPAMALAMEGSVDKGCITHWNADIYSQTHSGRPIPHRRVSNLIAAWHKSAPVPRAEARPGMGNHSGIHRNADPYYDLGSRRIIKHLVTDQRVRTSSTRGLGAFGNVFAIESFMDELARHTDIDPVAFRLHHLSDPRAIEVITRCREKADGYVTELTVGEKPGRGFAFARYKNRQTYAAITVFLTVNEETLEIRLRHAVITADAGQVIDSDGLANQLEGGFIQSSSWTLKEAVQFDSFATSSTDWESYPILRFEEVPTVDVELIDRPESPSLGAGEATQGPTPAAIANAIEDAVGIRLREIPFTTDRLRSAALDA